MQRMFLTSTLSLLVSSICAANGIQIEPLENIRETARQFVLDQTSDVDHETNVTVGRLDPRLRLARCNVPLNAYFSPGARTVGHTTVGIRCDGEKPWTLFVPTTVAQNAHVVVSSRALMRGQILTAEDVVIEYREVNPAHGGFFRKPEAVVGKVITRAAAAKTPLSSSMLKLPRLVRRGDRVQLAWSTGAVNVQMMGTALKDGVRGERIPVRNINSKRVVEGVVDGQGSVVVRAAPNI